MNHVCKYLGVWGRAPFKTYCAAEILNVLFFDYAPCMGLISQGFGAVFHSYKDENIRSKRLGEPQQRPTHTDIHIHILLNAEPFNKHIVYPSTFAIHANLNFILSQYVNESFACKLSALICIKDFTTVFRQNTL